MKHIPEVKIGDTFNNWKILELLPDKEYGKKIKVKHKMVLCECQCENKTNRVLRLTKVRTGSTKSCGCKKGSAIAEAHSLNLINKQFHFLTPIKKVGQAKDNHILWECLCNPKFGGCGKNKITSSSKLTSGQVKSCGCLVIINGQKNTEAFRKFNTQHSKNHISWRGYKDISLTYFNTLKANAKKKKKLCI
jgi:hypothetical protein